MTVIIVLYIMVAVLLFASTLFFLMWRAEAGNRKKRKRKWVARDKNGNPIYRDSLVWYRDEECRIYFDEAMFCYFIEPSKKENKVVMAIPFTIYAAAECEVIKSEVG